MLVCVESEVMLREMRDLRSICYFRAFYPFVEAAEPTMQTSVTILPKVKKWRQGLLSFLEGVDFAFLVEEHLSPFVGLRKGCNAS